jgi:hypothetical protein
MSKTGVLAAGLLILAGCARTVIESRRAPEMTEKLTELFVISEAGSQGELSSAAFEKEFVGTGQACGVHIGISSMSKLELDTSIHERRMQEFGARYVLTVAMTGGTKTKGTLTEANYDARLYQREPKKVIWRADVRFMPGGEHANTGETLALDLLRKMHSDALVKRCDKLIVPTDTIELRKARARGER